MSSSRSEATDALCSDDASHLVMHSIVLASHRVNNIAAQCSHTKSLSNHQTEALWSFDASQAYIWYAVQFWWIIIELITSALIHLLGKENTIPSLTFFASSCTDLHISVCLYQVVSFGKGPFSMVMVLQLYTTQLYNHHNTVWTIMWRSQQMISAITSWLDAANVTRYSAYSWFLPISI